MSNLDKILLPGLILKRNLFSWINGISTLTCSTDTSPSIVTISLRFDRFLLPIESLLFGFLYRIIAAWLTCRSMFWLWLIGQSASVYRLASSIYEWKNNVTIPKFYLILCLSSQIWQIINLLNLYNFRVQCNLNSMNSDERIYLLVDWIDFFLISSAKMVHKLYFKI